MAVIAYALSSWLLFVPQGGTSNTKPDKPAAPAAAPAARFDQHGWPIITGEASPSADSTREVAPVSDPGAAKPSTPPPAPVAETAPKEAIASGMDSGSPLLDVFAAVHAPGSFRALGCVTAWWRLTVFGAQGEVIGIRELTHTADLAFADRDRLEYPEADGRVFGRAGAVVFAERQGLPYPTLTAAAAAELQLFGLQLRLPWQFADGNAFAVVSRDYVTRGADKLLRIRVQQRLEGETYGPEPTQRPRDTFELWCDKGGLPVEFVHQFANSGQSRRVLLDDWRDVEGVRMPFRRTYVDESGRPSTMLDLLRVVQVPQLKERAFRL